MNNPLVDLKIYNPSSGHFTYIYSHIYLWLMQVAAYIQKAGRRLQSASPLGPSLEGP